MLKMKKASLLLLSGLFFVSCVSSKKYTELEALQKSTNDLLNTATLKLNACDEEKAAALANAASLENQLKFLKENNQDLINNLGNLTTLSQKGAENLEKSLESLKEKDSRIQTLRDAVTRKDSVTLALVTSLKGVLGNLADEDIEINVEKGVVYVSISDKLLFRSGSFSVNADAKEVLGKVATVINDKPELEFMVEGHTDNVPIKVEGTVDNWDLSVRRATSIVRILQNDFGVSPERMTAAGRGEYIPIADNNSSAGRAKNRRTRIVVLPKLDQFYDLINKGMDEAISASQE